MHQLQIKGKQECFAFLIQKFINPLSANPAKWSNTLSVFDHFVKLGHKGLSNK